MTAFLIIGTGWRSRFFLRIAAALPDRFRVTGIVSRDAGRRADWKAEWGVPTRASLADALAAERPDFVVVSVPRAVVVDIMAEVAGHDLPILVETPPAADLPGLLRVADLVRQGARIEVAEQYFAQPIHAARLAVIADGRIGRPSYAHVAVAHDYHGVSLMRKYLGLGFEPAEITAHGFAAPIVASPTRAGPPDDFRIDTSNQTIATFDFGDRLGLYDFTGDQYHGWIRTARLTIRGERGEIRDDEVRWLVDHRTPAMLRLWREDIGHGAELGGFHHVGILAGAEWVYRNPYPGARLMDDEIAIATCLDGMADFVATGRSFYSFAEAAQDTYLALTMHEARTTGRRIRTERQDWAE